MQIPRIALISLVLPLLAVLCGCKPGEDTRVSKAPASTSPTTQYASTNHADAVKLAKDIGCFACHSIEKKFLGPSWKNVAAMYRLDPAGEDKLLAKIAKGGSGVWGQIEMPAYPNVSEADRRVLVKFILSLE